LDPHQWVLSLNYSRESFGTGCKVIGVTSFKDRLVPDYDTLEEINPNGVVSKNDYLKSGDVVFVRSNGNKALVGRSLFIEKDESVAISGFCIRARLHDARLLPKYFAYFTKTDFFKRSIGHTASTSINNLNQGVLADVEIILPSVEDQSRIVEALDAIQKKITLNNQINAELEAMAKLIYDYWFIQFDFPDENGKPYKSAGGKMVWCDQLNREIPDGWAPRELHQIANITMGQSPAGSSFNSDGRGMLFYQGSTDFGWLFPTVRQYTTEPSRLAKKGDILLSVRAPVGDMNIANSNCCIGRGLAALNSRHGFDGYLFYVMKYFKLVFDRRNTQGTTFGSITKDDLHSLKVAYPSDPVLKDFENLVSPMNQMIFTRASENSELVKLRDWLLPMLMNGQVTVGDCISHASHSKALQ